MLDVQSFVAGKWVAPDASARPVESAITGAQIARAGSGALDGAAIAAYARDVGGPALRALGFHERAKLLKALAQALDAGKEALYALSHDTGATQADNRIDIDGGIGTLFVYASKGRRELPDGQVYLDGGPETLSRDGSFHGQHIYTPRTGLALQINAYNFPVWGMLEKLAPALLAGLPCVVKPATASSYVAEACFRMMLDTGLLPDGAVQLVTSDVSGVLAEMGPQDVIAFTGSAATADVLRRDPAVLERGAAFFAEQDSLNASVLGADSTPDDATFDTFLREVRQEITAKAGQKCTCMRRLIVPAHLVERVSEALVDSLSSVKVGDPRMTETEMGALISRSQRADVAAKLDLLAQDARLLTGGSSAPAHDTFPDGAFMPPTLLLCDAPHSARHVHSVEAFGPVVTLMPYSTPDEAADLANRGGGSLVASLFSDDPMIAAGMIQAMAPWHGRLYVNNARAASGATGHGAPLPHLIHGGPGRAGGGEELGGIRGVLHYMQRTAVQGDAATLRALTGQWMPSAPEIKTPSHPFRRSFTALEIGETLVTDKRTITLDDIEHFAHFTGDTFYAHMDEDAARANPFFPGRVAHGYLLLSFAAGLFVDPDPGPVLANTGLDELRFMKPVSAGDAISVRLTVKAKTRRTDAYGEVRWHVSLRNQDDELVAEYELLTMNAYDA